MKLKTHTASLVVNNSEAGVWSLTVWSPIHGPESQQPIVTATEESCLGSCENQRCCWFLQQIVSSSSSPPPPPPRHSLRQSLLSVPFCILLSSTSVHSSLSLFLLPLYFPLSYYFHQFLQHLFPRPSPPFTAPDISILHTRIHTHTLACMQCCKHKNLRRLTQCIQRREGNTRSHTARMLSDWRPSQGNRPIRRGGLPLDVFLSDGKLLSEAWTCAGACLCCSDMHSNRRNTASNHPSTSCSSRNSHQMLLKAWRGISSSQVSCSWWLALRESTWTPCGQIIVKKSTSGN